MKRGEKEIESSAQAGLKDSTRSQEKDRIGRNAVTVNPEGK